MTTVIAICNHKGGVAKTTSTLTLASALARMDFSILVIDLDPQANASLVLGKEHPARVEVTAAEVLLGENDILPKAIHMDDRTSLKGLSLIYGDIRLSDRDDEMRRISMVPVSILAEKIALLKGTFDFILIDCPPALSLLTANALASADYYIVPLKSGDQFGLHGMDSLQSFVTRVTRVNPKLKLLGALIVQHDQRHTICKVMAQAIKDAYPNTFNTTIGQSSKVMTAHTQKRSIIDFERDNPVSRDYRNLAQEILARIEKDIGQPLKPAGEQ